MNNPIGKWNIGIGLPFYLVLVGAVSIVAATLLMAIGIFRMRMA